MRQLGRSNLLVGRLGVASSYGGTARAYEMAYERGCNYFYWGSFRRGGMRDAILNLAPRQREKMVIALQSYSRLATPLDWSFKRGLRQLKLDYADVLILGWYNKPPSERLLDHAVRLREQGLIRAIAISSHERVRFQDYMKDPRINIIMVRYNAAHRGAEREVFPYLDKLGSDALGKPLSRPGVITYTTTRWGHLINPKKTPPGVRVPTAVDCYRFALSCNDVDVALCGPANDAQMEEDLRALELGPMNEEELRWMREVGDYVRANA
jgi:aryl-alcohol dehydrogenase-like predicted oxidoreductase